MGDRPRETLEAKRWQSVHLCPACGHAMKLAGLDLKAVTTGMVDCPACNRHGPIDIQIIQAEQPKH